LVAWGTVAALAACVAEDNGPPDAGVTSVNAAPSSSRALAEPAPAVAAATVGKGQVCPFSVQFSIPAKWRAIDASEHKIMLNDALLSCEIDGKPAGVVAFMRVWEGGPSTQTARQLGVTFIRAQAPKATDQVEQELTIGGANGAEFQYRSEGRLNRVFVVVARTAVVFVHLGGLDDAEHTAGLPAYMLARSTVTA
jgi:hypothetical protein